MADLSGRDFGPYQIIEPLGAGGMAVVYKAYQAAMERYVALKVLVPELASEPEFVGRFRQEARVLASMQHPHILPIFDFGEREGVLYIVMPYIETGTLEDLMRGEPLDVQHATRLTVQIAGALDYAHRRGLIHRDIKPSNILIDESGNCLLTDFGIAKLYEATTGFTSTGGIIGTPSYMSPEQGQGEKLDQCSDVYSLGVLFFEMVTGHVPFSADTPLAVVLRHITEPIPSPRSVNPRVTELAERVILKATAKKPADRFQSAGSMATALAHGDAATVVAPPQRLSEEDATVIDGYQPVSSATENEPRPFPLKLVAIGGGLFALLALFALVFTLMQPGDDIDATVVAGDGPIVSGGNDEEPESEAGDPAPEETASVEASAEGSDEEAAEEPTAEEASVTPDAPTEAGADPADGQSMVLDALDGRTELFAVEAGDTVLIDVTGGGWRAGPENVWPLVGAEGDSRTPEKASFPVPSAALMTLIGGVDDGAPFVVQPGRPVAITESGTFWLGPNDDDTSDNSGVLEIVARVEEAIAEVPEPTETPSATPRPTQTPTPSATAPPLGPEYIHLTDSAGGRAVEMVRFGNGPNVVVFVGGIHGGFAPSGVRLAEMAVAHFEENPGDVPSTTTVYVVRNLNPDSDRSPGRVPGRLNDNGVDLNRNWDCAWTRNPEVEGSRISGAGGDAPFSEPETRALSEFLLDVEARAVIFWEARSVPGMAIPGACATTAAVSNPLAVTYARPSGYRWQNIENMSGIDVEGDASNWLDQQGIPSIFVLLPHFTDVDWNNNLAGIMAVIREYGR